MDGEDCIYKLWNWSSRQRNRRPMANRRGIKTVNVGFGTLEIVDDKHVRDLRKSSPQYHATTTKSTARPSILLAAFGFTPEQRRDQIDAAMSYIRYFRIFFPETLKRKRANYIRRRREITKKTAQVKKNSRLAGCRGHFSSPKMQLWPRHLLINE